MTADNATIYAVTEAIKNTGAVIYSYTDLACAAIAKLEELGWGKKPTRSEALRLLDQDKNWDLQRLVDAGFLVEDPEPEWEPTDKAVAQAVHIYLNNPNGLDTGFRALLKYIRTKPQMVGLEGGE